MSFTCSRNIFGTEAPRALNKKNHKCRLKNKNFKEILIYYENLKCFILFLLLNNNNQLKVFKLIYRFQTNIYPLRVTQFVQP
jgi:hypothetical protein